MGLVLEPSAQLAHEARLADAGLAREQHHLPLAVRGLPPAAEQQGNLLLATDQRREARGLARLEAAFRTTFAFDPPGGERLGEAPQALRAEVGQLEQAAQEPARRLADDHAARLRERLEPCREVRRLADHRLLLRRALADQIADHHEARRDPDPGGERLT